MGRRYRARLYTDARDEANVMYLNGARPAEYEEDLVSIAEYLRQDAGVQTIPTLGAGGGFEPVVSFE
jgi:hypothetical protein